jgi:hypothetical protein
MGAVDFQLETIGPNRAKAWVVTVINPLLAGLARAQYYLNTRNWTWRYRTEWFEVLFPSAAMVAIPFHANLEDLVGLVEPARAAVQTYDRSLDALAERCAVAYQSLVADPEFVDRVKMSDESYEKDPVVAEQTRLREWWGALPREEAPNLAAERVVNRFRGDIYASDARFWETFGKDLVAFRDRPTHQVRFGEVDDSGAVALRSREAMEAALRSLRSDIGRKYDVPPVPV